ncbi:MAG: asparagine synthase-related protein, partial [Pseudomonadota bacterium]
MTDREPRRYSDPANHHSRSATNAAPKDTASPVYDGYAPYAYSTALEQNPASTSDALLIASDARIDNGDELRSALRLERAKSLDATDSLLILACYQRWGESFVERLIGDFAFVIVDRSRREVFAACDGMSMRTLYFAAQGSQLCFASDCGTLLRLPFVGSSLNSTAIALWVNGYPDPDLSMFKDIQRLRPGYCLRATNSGLSIRKFWDLDPDSSLRLATPADYADRLCSLLTQAVADRIPNGTDHVACQLSGGMDSPSIAASLCELGQDSGMPVHALSHQYPAASAQDETSDIDAIRSMLSLASHQYLRTEKYSSSSYADLYPSHGDSPGMVLSPRYSDDVVHAANQGARVLFTGSGGDEMCWGHSRSYERRLASGDLKVMAEVAAGCKEQSLPVAKTMMGLLFKPMLARILRRAGGTQSTGTRLPEWQDPSCTAANEVQDYIRAHSLSESRR